MRIRCTKKADGRHVLTVLRDDGTVSRGRAVPGPGVPHDVVHAVVEAVLGLKRGVYGMVNTGLDLADLLEPARKPELYQEPELMLSEGVTCAVQMFPLECPGASPDAASIDAWLASSPHLGAAVHAGIRTATERGVWAKLAAQQAAWAALPLDATLELEV